MALIETIDLLIDWLIDNFLICKLSLAFIQTLSWSFGYGVTFQSKMNRLHYQPGLFSHIFLQMLIDAVWTDDLSLTVLCLAHITKEDINCPMSPQDQRTALHVACEHGRWENYLMTVVCGSRLTRTDERTVVTEAILKTQEKDRANKSTRPMWLNDRGWMGKLTKNTEKKSVVVLFTFWIFIKIFIIIFIKIKIFQYERTKIWRHPPVTQCTIWAVFPQCHSAVITQLLLWNEAEPNVRDSDGRVPLQYAQQAKSSECYDVLLQNGAISPGRGCGGEYVNGAFSESSTNGGSARKYVMSNGGGGGGGVVGSYNSARSPSHKTTVHGQSSAESVLEKLPASIIWIHDRNLFALFWSFFCFLYFWWFFFIRQTILFVCVCTQGAWFCCTKWCRKMWVRDLRITSEGIFSPPPPHS